MERLKNQHVDNKIMKALLLRDSSNSGTIPYSPRRELLRFIEKNTIKKRQTDSSRPAIAAYYDRFIMQIISRLDYR